MMSWSSDVRCLYCDGRLPLYRKITNGQFCSAPHRKLYWQEQERLGVERLHQTQDSLRAFRPPEGVYAILGPPVLEPLGDPVVEPMADNEAPLAGLIPIQTIPQPRWPTDRLEMAEPKPLLPAGVMRIPLRAVAPLAADVAAAGLAKVPVAPRVYRAAPRVEPLPVACVPLHDVPLSLAPQGFDSAAIGTENDDIPRAEALPMAAFAAQDSASSRALRDPWPATQFAWSERAYLPLGTMECGVTPAVATPKQAGLRPLSIDQVPLVHGTWIDSLRAMGAETGAEMPRYELSTPAMRPRLRLAAGSRYAVATRDPGIAVATIEPESLRPADQEVAMPERASTAAAASASSSTRSQIRIPIPNAAGLLPLASAQANEPDSRPPAFEGLPQPLRTEPMRPASRLEPIDAKPVADFMAPAPAKKDAVLSGAEFVPQPVKDETGQTVWANLAGFWQHAPRDLKLLAFAIPILLGLALHPSLKKVPYTAPVQTAGIQRNFQSKLTEKWVNVRQTMMNRAAVALDEDFRAGLDDWTSRGGTTDWEFDATGFVRPGPLALYRPSLDLTDYQLQFLGMIDKKALSWVVRAADFDDYYVVKIVVLKPGPVPTIGVTRYAVIHGVAQDRGDTVALINAREDMLYRVQMDVHGDTFALTVQGQMVDSWSEPRLRKGGVGFFTARGEASRLRWVQVTHHYDMLGRLCAYLAPYNIPSTNGGGWQP